jgi:hypothetical protein
MQLTQLPEVLAVCRLAPDEELPRWAIAQKTFLSITYTAEELSIVCPENVVPAYIQCERHWRAFKVEGPLDFSLTGVLASLATPLAAGGVPIFTISTFDTDYILVKEHYVARVRKLLEPYGHTVT